MKYKGRLRRPPVRNPTVRSYLLPAVVKKIGEALGLAGLFCAAVLTFLSCGQPGSSDQSAAVSGATLDVKGSLTNSFGRQREMQGWKVVLLDKSTSIARVAEVDGSGLYTLKHVDLSRTYTIVLVSPDSVFSSILSITGVTGIRQNTVLQYFRITKNWLPQLILRGPVVNFQTLDGITPDKTKLIKDSSGSGVPDGVTNKMAASLHFNSSLLGAEEGETLESQGLLLATASTADLDHDGVTNINDVDIDGDGIPNVFDPDENSNNVANVLDPDSNGDYVADLAEKSGDNYFKEGIEFMVVQVEKTPNADGTFKTTIKFTTKVRNEVSPIAVQVRGSPNLFGDAVVETIIDDKGNTRLDSFADKRLLDDGKSEDAAEADRLFARRVTLTGTKFPKAAQVVFVQLAFGSATDPWFMEFPYTFPDVTLSLITGTYDAANRLFTLTGAPFGAGNNDFTWNVTVFDSSDVIVHMSESITGDQRNALMPSNKLRDGETYYFTLSAQLTEKVPGYPPYIIHSTKNKM